ncbi:MAG: helix-turn-helix domain-containing protein, partial [Desulfatiglandales bacterium]
LPQMVSEGSFREDLYFRLKVVQIKIPPLRERIEDIPELTSYFIKKINRELKLHIWKMEKGVLELLMAYSWPGNVRELENTLVEAMVRARGEMITKDTVRGLLGQQREHTADKRGLSKLELVEREHILEILKNVSFNRKKASEILGISLPTLRSKIKKYGIKGP